MSNSYAVILRQAIDLLSELNAEEYQKKLPPHFPSSIGTHIRHIVDHFIALMDGHQQGHVDYNKRNRHNDIEHSPCSAMQSLENLINWLNNLSDEWLDKPLGITTEIDVSRTCSTTCQSTLERELVFVSSHAIHHFALIKIMCGMQNKAVPEFFGYAPATITYLNRTA